MSSRSKIVVYRVEHPAEDRPVRLRIQRAREAVPSIGELPQSALYSVKTGREGWISEIGEGRER